MKEKEQPDTEEGKDQIQRRDTLTIEHSVFVFMFFHVRIGAMHSANAHDHFVHFYSRLHTCELLEKNQLDAKGKTRGIVRRYYVYVFASPCSRR
jgi:hypothetical protein